MEFQSLDQRKNKFLLISPSDLTVNDHFRLTVELLHTKLCIDENTGGSAQEFEHFWP